jgi:hypothetical protein
MPWISFAFLAAATPIAWLLMANERRKAADTEENGVDRG